MESIDKRRINSQSLNPWSIPLNYTEVLFERWKQWSQTTGKKMLEFLKYETKNQPATPKTRIVWENRTTKNISRKFISLSMFSTMTAVKHTIRRI